MNRKSKIIVSVVGILIVLLALLGLTYAYYLTRIVGNTNDTSISITTAKLELVYGDGTTEILEPNKSLVPTLTTTASDAIGKKDFTVTNTGDDSSYVVVIENVEIKKGQDETTFVTNDFKYTLTCTIISDDASRNGTSCNGTEILSSFPINGGILVGNEIAAGDVHNFEYTMWYVDNGLDQSDDMGKTLNARISISDITSINPFSENTDTLAYHILNNSINKTNGTKLVNTPPTKIAVDISSNNISDGVKGPIFPDLGLDFLYYGTQEELASCNGMTECPDATPYTTCNNDVVGKYLYNSVFLTYGPVTECVNGFPAIGSAKYESVLSTTEDDYGTSYYYRGYVQDNFVNFNGMCWRIVRIQGDGSVKLILEDKAEQCNDQLGNDLNNNGTYFKGDWGVESVYSSGFTNLNSDDADFSNFKYDYLIGEKQQLEAWFNYKDADNVPRFSDEVKNKIKHDNIWCIGDLTNTYSYNAPYNLLTTSRNINISNNISFYYETGKRIMGKGITPTSTLLCKNNNYLYDSSYVGTLNIDEVIFAGASYEKNNKGFYLSNTYQFSNDYELLIPTISEHSVNSWTADISDLYFTFYNGGLSTIAHTGAIGHTPSLLLRPSITLLDGITIIDGDGTQTDPYIIG